MPTTYRDLLEQTRREIQEIDPKGAQEWAKSGAAMIDIRETDEVATGLIPGAVHIPRGNLESKIEETVPDRDRPVVLYCAGGFRSVFAAKTLADLGYTNVVSMAGGFGAWKTEGLPLAMPISFKPEQRRRYSRHFLLPEVGEIGQRTMLDAKVLLIGAGGLGSPAGLYLAAAGIGTIGVIDDDVVDESNLQRQVLHSTDWIGKPKVDSARHTMTGINPDVNVVTHPVRLSKENVFEILQGYDLIVDGSDNFSTRYLINDATVLLGIPVVHGAIFRFEGQVTVFNSAGGPCYRCLFPEPPPPELAPNCAEAGVLGVLPGVVGTIQATEAVKLVLGIGDTLSGRLLSYDALEMSFREMRIPKDAECPMCGPNGPKSIEHIEYRDACAITYHAAAAD